MTVLQQKPIKNLGFDKLESAEITENLNRIIANYQVFFRKLQNFHWNITGGDFYDIHEITETLYKRSLENIDILAERVRVFNNTPIYKTIDISKVAVIQEVEHTLTGEMMINEIINDFGILFSFIIDTYEAANQNGDIGTMHLLSKMIQEIETDHWKLASFLS
jgi:starvation-inducible DNA-binding protein